MGSVLISGNEPSARRIKPPSTAAPSALGTWREGREESGPQSIAVWDAGNCKLYELTPDRAAVLGQRLLDAGRWAKAQEA